MAFTVQQLANIANAALNFYIKGPAYAQTIQEKPLLKAMREKQKTFPGGKGEIDLPVKGEYTTALAGYTGNDTVTYANPANIKRVKYPWRELHAGIGITYTELKIDGISVNTSNGKSTSEHSGRDLTVLTGLLDDKLDDMAEGWARSFNNMLWLDGTQDAKQVAGITAILTDTPSVGVLGGLDRATTTWWRHRALVGANKITASASLQTLTKTLRKEVRQLRRYSKKTDYILLAGSLFLEALEIEVFEKGLYTQQGFINNGKNDIGMSDIAMRGVGTFQYDPTLDDLGFAKRAFFIDLNGIQLMPMEGEEDKTHNPERPYDQYAMYRAMTWTGGLVCRQLNSSGVYEVA